MSLLKGQWVSRLHALRMLRYLPVTRIFSWSLSKIEGTCSVLRLKRSYQLVHSREAFSSILTINSPYLSSIKPSYIHFESIPMYKFISFSKMCLYTLRTKPSVVSLINLWRQVINCPELRPLAAAIS